MTDKFSASQQQAQNFRPTNENPPNDSTSRKKISTACNECKRRKIRCAPGPPPCPTCRATGSECVFEEDQDKRRRSGPRKSMNMVQRADSVDVLNAVLAVISSQDEDQMHRLNQIALENLPPTQLVQAITEGISVESGSPTSPLSAVKSVSSDGTPPLTSHENEPPYGMHAAPWTTIISDDRFASELLSLYLAWQHPCFPIFHVPSFLEACAGNNIESLYCSRLLVNAIFAIGCVRQVI